MFWVHGFSYPAFFALGVPTHGSEGPSNNRNEALAKVRMRRKLLAIGIGFPLPEKTSVPMAEFAGERFFVSAGIDSHCKVQPWRAIGRARHLPSSRGYGPSV